MYKSIFHEHYKGSESIFCIYLKWLSPSSEAQSEMECIRCFCFGESTQCHSADLFTYNMPTPLGEGGTRLVDVRLDNGQIEIDKKVSNQYFYQPLWNGATVSTDNSITSVNVKLKLKHS